MTYDFHDARYWQDSDCDREVRRIFDVCHGCRLCYRLCPSFPSLFEALDAQEGFGDAEKLSGVQIDRVVDLCYQCKLCYNKCPYTPPHRYQIDFPRLMLRAKALRAEREGVSFQDRVLASTDFLGKWGSRFAPLANASLKVSLFRWAMEKLAGIHRRRLLPPLRAPGFPVHFRRWAGSGDDAGSEAVALFSTCLVNYHFPEVGRAALSVLRRNGVAALLPAQRCCGMPALDGGDTQRAAAQARFNVEHLLPAVRRGAPVVVLQPTCGYVLKQEYPLLLGTPEAKEVASRTLDLCEFLWQRHGRGKLNLDFSRSPGKVAYHLPCHLKAQNIGVKSRDLLELIPGTQVELVDRCSAIDGTWGLKKEHFDQSLQIAAPLLQEVQACSPDLVASDCSLAGLQILQGTGRKPLHPVEILARAYGD